MSAGLGSLSSLGVVKETVENTAEDPATCTYIPILSESMSANRAAVQSGSLLGNRMLTNVALGIQTANGGFQMEVEGSAFALALWLWNGDGGYSFAAVGGYATAAPTGSASAGGALSVGNYKYKVASVLTRTVDSRLIIMPGSTASANIAASGSDLQIDLTWTNVAAPTGYTHTGTVIFRTTVGGSTYYFDKYVAGTGNTTTSSIADSALDTTVGPYSTIPNRHRYKGTVSLSNTDPIYTFSMVVNKNNDNAEEYVGCRLSDMGISMGDPNAAITADFSVLARNVVPVANQTPSFTALEPFVGWSCKAYINGTADCTIEGINLSCSNNVQPVGGLCAVPYNQGNISGMRSVSGTLSRQFSNHDFWDKMLAGEEFALRITAFGQPLVATGSSLQTSKGHAIDATPFQYYLDINLFKCRASKAGGSVSGPDQIKESVEFTKCLCIFGFENHIKIRRFSPFNKPFL